jgi:hypothetical protein
VTWAHALEVWQRYDGTVMSGLLVYTVLKMRGALRRTTSALQKMSEALQAKEAVIHSQNAVMQSLLALARRNGWMIDPDDSDSQPRRLN